MEKRTKILLIILSVLVLFFFIFWIYLNSTSQTFKCNTLTIESLRLLVPAESIGGREAVDFCLYHEAWDKKSKNICHLIENSGRQDDCYSVVSISAKDESLCANIGIEWYRNSCYRNVAKEKMEVTICNFISGSEVSTDEGDGIVMPSEKYKKLCFGEVAVLTKDANICKSIINNPDRENCFWMVARDTRNKEICNLINDNISRGNCISDTKCWPNC